MQGLWKTNEKPVQKMCKEILDQTDMIRAIKNRPKMPLDGRSFLSNKQPYLINSPFSNFSMMP